jgi:hypothetical protein
MIGLSLVCESCMSQSGCVRTVIKTNHSVHTCRSLTGWVLHRQRAHHTKAHHGQRLRCDSQQHVIQCVQSLVQHVPHVAHCGHGAFGVTDNLFASSGRLMCTRSGSQPHRAVAFCMVACKRSNVVRGSCPSTHQPSRSNRKRLSLYVHRESLSSRTMQLDRALCHIASSCNGSNGVDRDRCGVHGQCMQWFPCSRVAPG